MAKGNLPTVLPDEVLLEKIYVIRDKKVMIDSDLAELYGVETRRLKEQVRRNISRFPEDFMFELSEDEHQQLKELFGRRGRGSHSKYPPFAFTEHGVLMLASVLNSERAIQINIQIVRVFTRMREMLSSHKEVLHKLETMEKKLAEHDTQILVVFEYLKQLEEVKQKELEQKNRKPIGYR